MPLYQMVKEGKFRQDLYTESILWKFMSPFRERIEDIPPLIDHFLEIYCKKYKIPSKTSKRIYHFPS